MTSITCRWAYLAASTVLDTMTSGMRLASYLPATRTHTGERHRHIIAILLTVVSSPQAGAGAGSEDVGGGWRDRVEQWPFRTSTLHSPPFACPNATVTATTNATRANHYAKQSTKNQTTRRAGRQAGKVGKAGGRAHLTRMR
jgi:hypothetical protein